MGSWLLILLGLLACSLPTAVSTPLPPTPTIVPLPTQAELVAPESGQPLSGETLPLTAVSPIRPIAPYTLPTVNLPPGRLRAPLTPNLDDLPLLNEPERAQLLRDGWVIAPDPYANPYDIYAEAQAAGQPIFISQDLLLLATQTMHQEVMAEARALYLPAYLRQMTETLTAVLSASAASEESAVWAEAARRNLAYVTIAGLFLDPTYPIPPEVVDLVESELTLTQQAGEFVSPLFGRVVDYTPLTTAVSPVEKTLLWYRQYGWQLSPTPDGQPSNPDRQRAEARQILLWLRAIGADGPAQAAWERVAQPLAYLDGAEGTAVGQWQAIRQQTEPTAQPLDSFIQTAQQLPDPTLRLLPPPQDEHGRVMTALSYNRVGGYTGNDTDNPPFSAGDTAVGLVRLFPATLDTAAAAGSDVALRRLQNGGDASYEGYNIQLSAVRETFLPAVAEARSYETAWLLTLAPLVAENDPATRTAGQQTASWADYELSRWQLGWLLPRVNLMPADFPPRDWSLAENTAVYLDPQPVLYARLGAHTNQLLQGLGQAGWLTQPGADRLQELKAILLVAQATAVREQAGQTLGEVEQQFLAELLGRLHAITGDLGLPYTAVVHTDPTTGQQVTLRTPSAYPLYVFALHEGQPTLFTGATLLPIENK